MVFWLAVKRAMKIITPSEFVKNELVKEYHLDPQKIIVTYEGVGDKLKVKSEKLKVGVESLKLLERYHILKPFILYVGSVYPHKNVERLIEAVGIINKSIMRVHFVIVCSRSVFWERLKKKVEEMKASEFVTLTGFVPDEELVVLYKEAEAFVFPTLSEGFGLPGLEAMAAGCPVICSDIPVLREVYKDAALYFNPYDSTDIADKIKNFLSDKKLTEELRKIGPLQAKEYSWEKMAKETLGVYGSLG